MSYTSTDKLLNVLERSNGDSIDSKTRSVLKFIEKFCGPCQFQAESPHRFNFSLRKVKYFNRTIYVDISYLESKLVLNVVDKVNKLPNSSLASQISVQNRCGPRYACGGPTLILDLLILRSTMREGISLALTSKQIHIRFISEQGWYQWSRRTPWPLSNNTVPS